MTPLECAELMGSTPGWFLPEEASALHRWAMASRSGAILVEIGSWAGRSTLVLADAARRLGGRVVAVDHFQGNREQEPGGPYHDPAFGAPPWALPTFLRTIVNKGFEDVIIPLPLPSSSASRIFPTIAATLDFLFIDGSHDAASVRADWEHWGPLLASGRVAFHDIDHPGVAEALVGFPLDLVERVLGCGLYAQPR